jgi:hypothetical protein
MTAVLSAGLILKLNVLAICITRYSYRWHDNISPIWQYNTHKLIIQGEYFVCSLDLSIHSESWITYLYYMRCLVKLNYSFGSIDIQKNIFINITWLISVLKALICQSTEDVMLQSYFQTAAILCPYCKALTMHANTNTQIYNC